MPIGLKGMLRLPLLKVGQPFECPCGAGIIEKVESIRRGDEKRVTCICMRTIETDSLGWYTTPNKLAAEAGSTV